MNSIVSTELQPSLLDRLIDEDPSQPDKIQMVRGISLQQLRLNVRRDLENLLNAKMQWLVWPKAYKELDKSLINYGLPDFSSMPVGSLEGRQILCKRVAETIRLFEPRFLEVDVTTATDEQELDRTLRLRISALLFAEPEPQYITFDSEIEPVHLGLVVKETVE